MTAFPKNTLWLPLLFASGFLIGVRAESLILAGEGGWNGFVLENSIKAGFRPAGGLPGTAPEVAVEKTGFLSVVPHTDPAGTTLSIPQLAVSVTPGTGDPKDIASGVFDTSFTIGTATTDDAFNFSFTNTTSAFNAQVDFGSGLEDADAFFEATFTLITFAPATIPGAVLSLPDLPALGDDTHESMSATISTYVGGAPFFDSFSPGESGITVPVQLVGDQLLEYQFTYAVTTPFGTDPTHSYALDGAAAVPELSTGALSLIGLLICLGTSLAFRRCLSRQRTL